MLLDKGADVNAQGGEYGTALHAASKQGHKEVVEMLLDKSADNAGARLDALDTAGRTPLREAVASKN
ncbi:hypothetical protein N0V85_009709, partial [Neurospora sp. IMI 360204]